MSPDQISATNSSAPTVSVRSRAPPLLDAKAPPKFSQQTPQTHKLSQPPPQIPEILSTNARAFELSAVTPLGPSEIFATGGPLTRSLEAPLNCIIERLFVVFLWSCGLSTPFNVKITVTR